MRSFYVVVAALLSFALVNGCSKKADESAGVEQTLPAGEGVGAVAEKTTLSVDVAMPAKYGETEEASKKVVISSETQEGAGEVVDTQVAETSAEGTAVSSDIVEYKIQEGDTLDKIARKFYGAGSKWTLIFEANKDVIKSPEKIWPGMVLKIPNPTKQE